MPPSPLLEVENLTIRLGDKQLLAPLSYRILAGEVLGLVGESGSGKSLSALALLGLLPREMQVSGQLTLNGQTHDLSQPQRLAPLRGQQIGMIFQEPMTALNPLHRIGKQIGEMLLQRGMSRAAVRQAVLKLLEQVRIPQPEQKIDRYPHELSGGQRQRVMIAMALAQQPRVLIADEPTTALDVTVQTQILELLAELQQQHQMAVLLISHDLGLIERYAKEVVVLLRGEVVESGNTKMLFQQPQQPYTRELLNQDFGVAPPPVRGAPLLTLQQLGVRFPIKGGLLNRVRDWTVAVEPLSLTLHVGESLGIVGESGSGKTSLALAIARLISSEGEIQLNGQTLNGLPESRLRPLRSQFQIVFQDPFSSLNPRFTIEDIVSEGLLNHVSDRATIRQRVITALEQVELPADMRHRYPHELSGGQRQRVALARALIMQPRLLILDEPTSALDRTTQRALVRLLRRLQIDMGLSYLFISHDLAVIRALCQMVLVLHHGKVMEMQPVDQLFAHPQTDYTRALIEAARLTPLITTTL